MPHGKPYSLQPYVVRLVYRAEAIIKAKKWAGLESEMLREHNTCTMVYFIHRRNCSRPQSFQYQ